MEFQSAGPKISYAFLVKPKVAVLSDVTWVFFDVDLAKMNRKLQHSISFKGQLISKALFGVLNSSRKQKRNWCNYYDTSGQIVFVRSFGKIEMAQKTFQN